MATVVRDAWTDERLDDLNKRVDGGFGEMRQEFRSIREEMRDEFRAVRGEIQGVRNEVASLSRSFQQLTWGLIGAILVGFLSTAAAIISQL